MSLSAESRNESNTVQIMEDSLQNDHSVSPPGDCTKIIKQYEDGFVVRTMTAADTHLVMKWFDAVSPTGCDLELALQASGPDPVGYFIGEIKGEAMASAIRIQVADGIYYGSCFFVVEKYRRKGFGRRIRDEVAVKVVGNNILAIDAVDELEAMNVRRGHVTSHRVNMYEGIVRPSCRHSTEDIIDVDKIPFEEVLAYDDQCYIRPGSSWRRRFLQSLVALPGGRAVVARGKGGVVGLGCRRPTFQKGHHRIGPLYADSPDIARDLVSALTEDIPGENVHFAISEDNADAVDLVSSLGLKIILQMVRMYMNGHPGNQSDRVFAITSDDVCGF